MLNRRLHRLVRVYTCQNVKLLEITCGSSFDFVKSILLAAGKCYQFWFVIANATFFKVRVYTSGRKRQHLLCEMHDLFSLQLDETLSLITPTFVVC